MAYPSNRRRRADGTGLPRPSRRARLAPALPPKQPLWPSHTSLGPLGCVHGPTAQTSPPCPGLARQGLGDAAILLEALISGHSDLCLRKLVMKSLCPPGTGARTGCGTRASSCLSDRLPGVRKQWQPPRSGPGPRGSAVRAPPCSLGFMSPYAACPPTAGTQNPQLRAASRGGGSDEK